MTLQPLLQALIYFGIIFLLLFHLLPKLIDALTWDGDFPEYGKWFSREYFDD